MRRLGIVALTLLLGSCGRSADPPGVPPACNRACLENLADRFLDAMLRHDASRLPLGAQFHYVEDGQRLQPGDGSWLSLQSIGPYKQYVTDTQTGNVALLTTQESGDGRGLLVLRLQVARGAIDEAELLRVPAPAGHAAYANLFRGSTRLAPTGPAAERTELVAVANQYYSALENNDGKGDYSFFDPQCQRRENGIVVTHNTNQQQWPFDHPEFFALGCRAQLETGVLGLITRIRDRRYEVVDAERGQILSLAVFDHDATQQTLELTDGNQFAVPSFYRVPRSLMVATLLHGGDDGIDGIQQVQREVPYGLRPGFRSTFEPSSAVPGGRPPRAGARCDRDCVTRGLTQLLAALQSGHPERAPLAGLLRYTENDQHLAVGDGLWGTLTKVAGQPLLAVDGDQGWLLVGIEQHGVPGRLSLRARFTGDRIAEIEVQASATAQGLPTDLWPASATALSAAPVQDTTSTAPRSALAGAVEQWFADALPVLKGHGGRLRDRRLVVLDAQRGLAVSRLYVDLPRGSAQAPGAATALVEVSLSIHQGQVQRVAGTQVLLPYGSLPAWTATR